MGPPSPEESQEDDGSELEGLEPTDDELREAPNEEDEEKDPEEDEEESGQRGQMLSFGPPSKLSPRRDGPEGSNWCRVDFIVDSGASDNTLPLGVLPGFPMKPPQGFKDFALANGRIIPNLGQKVVLNAFRCGLVLTGTFSVVDKATTQCGQDDKLGTHCEDDARRWPDRPEERQVHQDLLQERCMENPNLDLVSR